MLQNDSSGGSLHASFNWMNRELLDPSYFCEACRIEPSELVASGSKQKSRCNPPAVLTAPAVLALLAACGPPNAPRLTLHRCHLRPPATRGRSTRRAGPARGAPNLRSRTDKATHDPPRNLPSFEFPDASSVDPTERHAARLQVGPCASARPRPLGDDAPGPAHGREETWRGCRRAARGFDSITAAARPCVLRRCRGQRDDGACCACRAICAAERHQGAAGRGGGGGAGVAGGGGNRVGGRGAAAHGLRPPRAHLRGERAGVPGAQAAPQPRRRPWWWRAGRR